MTRIIRAGRKSSGADEATPCRTGAPEAAPGPEHRFAPSFLGPAIRFGREVAQEFQQDECPRLAAAMSYYTVLALPPLLMLLLTLAGALLEPAEVQRLIDGQLGQFIGPEGMRPVRAVLRNLPPPGGGTRIAAVLSVLGLLFGATGAFVQLQTSLNKAWEIAPDPARGGIHSFLTKRFTSFLMVLGVGAVLLSSVVLNTTMSAFGNTVAGMLPGPLSAVGLRALGLAVSFGIAAVLFAALFKVLPDAVLHWRDVAVGATVTALLFMAGKALFGIYVGQSDPGSAYGAAGSLAVLLVWIYVSSMLLLLGAEFTQVWARHHGVRIIPQPGAICTRGERAPASPRPGWRTHVHRWTGREG